MLTKGLPRNCVRSQIVMHYIGAHKKIFGSSPWVSNKAFPLFASLEDDLRELNIPTRKFAYTVIAIMKRSCKRQGLDCVPPRMFASQYAVDRFLAVYNSESVEINVDVEKDEVLHSELLVARKFVSDNISIGFVRFGDIVNTLKPLLSDKWVELYEGGGERPVKETIDILRQELGVKKADNYFDIVDALT